MTRGFTLIEMLAAMTLFFLVVGILSSAVTQALRLAELDRTEALHTRDTMMRLGWFRDSVALAIIPGGDIRIPMTGSTKKIAGYTLGALDAANTGPGGFTWQIAFNSTSGESELQYVGGDAAPKSVFAWPGSNGGFRFLDESGQWTEQWPPDTFGLKLNAKQPSSPLPEAVAFEYGLDRHMVLSAIQNRLSPPPALKDMLQ